MKLSKIKLFDLSTTSYYKYFYFEVSNSEIMFVYLVKFVLFIVLSFKASFGAVPSFEEREVFDALNAGREGFVRSVQRIADELKSRLAEADPTTIPSMPMVDDFQAVDAKNRERFCLPPKVPASAKVVKLVAPTAMKFMPFDFPREQRYQYKRSYSGAAPVELNELSQSVAASFAFAASCFFDDIAQLVLDKQDVLINAFRYSSRRGLPQEVLALMQNSAHTTKDVKGLSFKDYKSCWEEAYQDSILAKQYYLGALCAILITYGFEEHPTYHLLAEIITDRSEAEDQIHSFKIKLLKGEIATKNFSSISPEVRQKAFDQVQKTRLYNIARANLFSTIAGMPMPGTESADISVGISLGKDVESKAREFFVRYPESFNLRDKYGAVIRVAAATSIPTPHVSEAVTPISAAREKLRAKLALKSAEKSAPADGDKAGAAVITDTRSLAEILVYINKDDNGAEGKSQAKGKKEKRQSKKLQKSKGGAQIDIAASLTAGTAPAKTQRAEGEIQPNTAAFTTAITAPVAAVIEKIAVAEMDAARASAEERINWADVADDAVDIEAGGEWIEVGKPKQSRSKEPLEVSRLAASRAAAPSSQARGNGGKKRQAKKSSPASVPLVNGSDFPPLVSSTIGTVQIKKKDARSAQVAVRPVASPVVKNEAGVTDATRDDVAAQTRTPTPVASRDVREDALLLERTESGQGGEAEVSAVQEASVVFNEGIRDSATATPSLAQVMSPPATDAGNTAAVEEVYEEDNVARSDLYWNLFDSLNACDLFALGFADLNTRLQHLDEHFGKDSTLTPGEIDELVRAGLESIYLRMNYLGNVSVPVAGMHLDSNETFFVQTEGILATANKRYINTHQLHLAKMRLQDQISRRQAAAQKEIKQLLEWQTYLPRLLSR